jgi:hypothetical protein
MARIRTIKPEFFEHEGLASCSPYARLLAISLLTQADRVGRLRWVKMKIHAASFPYEPEIEIEQLADELAKIGYLQLYEVDGKRYCEIKNFEKHQRISGTEAQSSIAIPSPSASDGSTGVLPEEIHDASKVFPGTGELGNRGTGEEEVCSELSEDGKASEPNDPVILQFPTVGKRFKTWDLRQSKVAEYIESFPGVDVAIQCKRALQWCRDNPTKRKTPRGMPAFLTRWLSAEQNKGPNNGRDGPEPESRVKHCLTIEEQRRAKGEIP